MNDAATLWKPRVVQATFENGLVVQLPRMPIERASLPIPGYVQRPDGSVIYVEDVSDE
jgi:hypothetical protein